MRSTIFTPLLALPLLCLTARAAAPAVPSDLTQTDAQTAAGIVNQLGSDQSLRNSSTTAMRALLQFSDNDVRGAVTSAFSAYRSFKTSENLDRAHKQGLLVKAQMSSSGADALTDGERGFLASSTSYRRLDPSFLSSGDDAKLAAEFEKRTGIKRGDFLNMLASAAENKLYVSDPRLAEKVDQVFDDFVKRIPNAEFREKVENALQLVPSLSRHKLMVESVQAMVQVAKKMMGSTVTDPKLAGAADGKPVAETKPPVAEERKPSSASGESPAAPGKELAATPEELHAITHPVSLNSDEIARAREDHTPVQKLDGVIEAAITEDPEKVTIFEIVSRKYRVLTPGLTGRKAP